MRKQLPPTGYHEPAEDGTRMVDPWSHDRIVLDGEYSVSSRPHYTVEISATDRKRVTRRSEQVGTPDRYSEVIIVENRNDSPAFVRVVMDSEGSG